MVSLTLSGKYRWHSESIKNNEERRTSTNSAEPAIGSAVKMDYQKVCPPAQKAERIKRIWNIKPETAGKQNSDFKWTVPSGVL